jgi:molybdopterin-binding protein
VRSLVAVGHEMLAELVLGDVTLRARLTPAAARELGLAAGRRAVAVVKTSAVHHLGG